MTTQAQPTIPTAKIMCDRHRAEAGSIADFWTNDAEFEPPLCDRTWTNEERFAALQRSVTNLRAQCGGIRSCTA